MSIAQAARMLEAADREAAFDWDEYNAQFDADMGRLKQSLAEYTAIEAEINKAHVDLLGDLRGIIEGTVL